MSNRYQVHRNLLVPFPRTQAGSYVCAEHLVYIVIFNVQYTAYDSTLAFYLPVRGLKDLTCRSTPSSP